MSLMPLGRKPESVCGAGAAKGTVWTGVKRAEKGRPRRPTSEESSLSRSARGRCWSRGPDATRSAQLRRKAHSRPEADVNRRRSRSRDSPLSTSSSWRSHRAIRAKSGPRFFGGGGAKNTGRGGTGRWRAVTAERMVKAAAQCVAGGPTISVHERQANEASRATAPSRKDCSRGSNDPRSKGTTTVRELSDSHARNAWGKGIDKTELANSWAARTASRRVANSDGCRGRTPEGVTTRNQGASKEPATSTKIIDRSDRRGGGGSPAAGRAVKAPAANCVETAAGVAAAVSGEPAEAEESIVTRVCRREKGCEQPPRVPFNSVAKQNPAGACEWTKSATTTRMLQHPRATCLGRACGCKRSPRQLRSIVRQGLDLRRAGTAT